MKDEILKSEESDQKLVLALDITSIPRGLTVTQIVQFYKDKKIVLWESYYNGHPPCFVNKDKSYDHDVVFVNTAKMTKKELDEYKKNFV